MPEPTARFLVLRKKRQVHCSGPVFIETGKYLKKKEDKKNLNNTVTEISLQNDGRMDSYKEKTISVLLSSELNKPV